MFPEDFLYPGSTLYIAQMMGNPFLEQLTILINRYPHIFNLTLHPVDTSNNAIWLRDYFFHFEANNGKIKHLLPMPFGAYNTPAMRNAFDTIIQQEKKNYFFYQLSKNRITSSSSNRQRKGFGIASSLLQKPSASLEDIHKKNSKLKQLAKLAHIEGGNTFSVYNRERKPYILIGELSLLWTAAQRGCHTPYDQDAIKKIIADTLSFNPDSIIVLPQVNYHIDLQIGYLGDGRIILNDYSLCIRVLEEMLTHPESYLSSKELSNLHKLTPRYQPKYFSSIPLPDRCSILQEMLAIAKKLNLLFENQIRTIYTKLIEQQFTVIRVPGIFYYPDYTKEKIDLIPIAQFMNGLGGKATNDHTYFLTANSPVKHFKDIFSSYLNNFGITKVYYLGDAIRATAFIANTKGSLRCLTTTHLEKPVVSSAPSNKLIPGSLGA